jgi:hypothetical protein
MKIILLFVIICVNFFNRFCFQPNVDKVMFRENILYIERFNGLEEYEIGNAYWNLYQDKSKINLCIYLDSNKGIKLNEDLADIFQMLHWELNLVVKFLKEDQLNKGYNVKIPNSYDEGLGGWITNFYYFEHEGSENNQIEILERKNDKLLIKITGEIIDVNYYDDSKPKSKLTAITWFTKNTKNLRSMQ